MSEYWVLLKDATNAGLVGGKAYQMSNLLKICKNTPDGVAITTEMMKSFLMLSDISEEEIEKALSLDENALNKVSSVLKNSPWPSKIKKELSDAYKLLNGSVCVRSSAISEDGKSHSFAGVYRTNLNLRSFGEFLWGIRDCWLSAVDENAVNYAKAVNEKLSLMALVVQPLLSSVKSGIAVVDGDILTISATLGQGQGAVSGQIPCDTYKINRSYQKVFEKINEKNTCYLDNIDSYPVWYGDVYRVMDDGFTQGFYVKNTDERNAMLFCSIHPDQFGRGHKSVLTDDQLDEISKILFRLADSFGGNWDFEWSVTNDKVIHILQARPLLSSLECEPVSVESDNENVLEIGVPISKGEVNGTVVKINSDKDISRVNKGNIVAIDWIPESCISVLNKASGLIIGDTSVISHCAIIAREWGIPCVGGINKSILVEGNTYYINGTTGVIKNVNSADSPEKQNDRTEKQSVDVMPIMFWLVLNTDYIMFYNKEIDECVMELSELCSRYDICRYIDFSGISRCDLNDEKANAVFVDLCKKAYKMIVSSGYKIQMSEKDKEFIGER